MRWRALSRHSANGQRGDEPRNVLAREFNIAARHSPTETGTRSGSMPPYILGARVAELLFSDRSVRPTPMFASICGSEHERLDRRNVRALIRCTMDVANFLHQGERTVLSATSAVCVEDLPDAASEAIALAVRPPRFRLYPSARAASPRPTSPALAARVRGLEISSKTFREPT